MVKSKKAKYLIEKYRDKFNTLHQAILIDLDINDESNGKEAEFMRGGINPNLTILYEKIYENEKHKFLKIQRLINDNWYEIDANTFEIIGRIEDEGEK